MIKSQNSTKTSTKSELYTPKKKSNTQIRKSEEISEANLFTCGRVGIELEGKSGIGSEGVSVEMREALRDVRGRQSEPQILNRTAQRGCFSVEFFSVVLLLCGEYYWDRLLRCFGVHSLPLRPLPMLANQPPLSLSLSLSLRN